MGLFKALFGSGHDDKKRDPTPPPGAAPEKKAFVHPVAAMEEALKAHGDEVNKAMTSENKKKAFEAWRTFIDTNQHDFADLVAHDSKSGQLMKLEMEVVMRTFACGVMVQRDWIEELTAPQTFVGAYRIPMCAVHGTKQRLVVCNSHSSPPTGGGFERWRSADSIR